jgi:UDP-N-acetylmuramoyl-L-alanyl-D-glutamate--2,6-diaminopimelate ligase
MRVDDLVVASGLAPLDVVGDAATPVTDVVDDSRTVKAGALFCCVPGDRTDGHDHAAAAVAGGATALLVERRLDLPVAQVVVADSRVAMGHLAAAFHGHPSRRLTMVGVTGTNGKTTTTSLIAAVLRHAGWTVGHLGTLTGPRTTPESPELQRRLADFVSEGAQAVVMEVSSHALALHRVTGCHFDLAVFTNLGRDHLDLHGTVERYFAAKAMLFTPALADRGIVNLDDPHGQLLRDAATIPMTGFSLAEVDDLRVGATRHAYRWRGELVEVGIGGRFNASNSLAAATVCAALDLDPATIAAGLASAPSVPGRFEPVAAGQPFDVIVDYAHTPDGLREALDAARDGAAGGRVIVVFGCGGDRDRDKRPEMGAVAADLADLVVVTSDNPRSEDPLAIIGAIVAGVPAQYRDRVVTEPDRRRSFAAAFAAAHRGDVVVIAGKGHETTQTVGTSVLPFDDRTVARELLERLP